VLLGYRDQLDLLEQLVDKELQENKVQLALLAQPGLKEQQVLAD
jgi:hypothetical protein